MYYFYTLQDLFGSIAKLAKIGIRKTIPSLLSKKETERKTYLRLERYSGYESLSILKSIGFAT